jgi:PhnB protein
MSKKVSPIPRGYRTATPCLTVDGVDSAVAFYQAAFGAEMLTRQSGVDESVALHATIKIGNSVIALNQQAPEMGILSPMAINGSAAQTHLYVDDVDGYWNRAVEAGAMIRTALFDAYWGDRTGVLIDPNGHLWSLASKIENLSKDEIASRAKAEFAPVDEFAPEYEYLDPSHLAEVPVMDETVAA